MSSLLQLKEEVDPFTNYVAVYSIDDPKLTNKLRDIVVSESKKYSDITNQYYEYDALSWDYPELKELTSLFKEALGNYLMRRGLKPLSCTLSSWASIRSSNSRHPAHCHPMADIVMNYYVATPRGTGITMHNPVKAMSFIQWSNMYAEEEYTIWTTEGDLVVSPGWLTHEVPYTTEDKDRISISVNVMNLKVEKI